MTSRLEIEKQLASLGGQLPVGNPSATGKSASRIPEFFVIGAMRAGTTTLFHYLNQFPDVGMAPKKETDFFISETRKPHEVASYLNQFDASKLVLGEASPNYTKHDVFPGVPGRIASFAPNSKFIFIARDPVDRFVSHYQHAWLHGHMSVQPRDLLASPNGHHMLDCSRYHAQIQSYLTHFKLAAFLFLDFEEICTQPQFSLNKVADFLEIPHHAIAKLHGANGTSELARIPTVALKIWRTPFARRFASYVPLRPRKIARKMLAFRHDREAPVLGEHIRRQIALEISDDAANFRRLTDLEFRNWQV